MGRIIHVRWDLKDSPDDLNLVVQIPENITVGRGTLHRIYKKPLKWFRKIMADRTNWVGLLGHFGYEQALSDYVALYPHRLEDGLLRHPSNKIRERIFKDRSRLDVLLIDKERRPVVVECKQESPDLLAIRQLRHYMELLQKELRSKPRGILVHGGARKLRQAVQQEAAKPPKVEIIQYKLDVDFAPSN
jgi:hypothetical protein